MCANSWLLFHKAHDIFIKQETFKAEVDEELCKVSPSEKVIQKRKSSNHNEQQYQLKKGNVTHKKTT